MHNNQKDEIVFYKASSPIYMIGKIGAVVFLLVILNNFDDKKVFYFFSVLFLFCVVLIIWGVRKRNVSTSRLFSLNEKGFFHVDYGQIIWDNISSIQKDIVEGGPCKLMIYAAGLEKPVVLNCNSKRQLDFIIGLINKFENFNIRQIDK